MATVTLYIELVPSAKWPYIGVGRTWTRRPARDGTHVVKVNLNVPNGLFSPVVTVDVTIPDRPKVSGDAEWGTS